MPLQAQPEESTSRAEAHDQSNVPDWEETSRRKFLSGAVVAAAATDAAPSVVKARGPISMRRHSTWPAKDIFREFALAFARKVNDVTGGDRTIAVLPAGAVVPAFGLRDAVSKRTLDGGHGVSVYHHGTQPALALWDPVQASEWVSAGGGRPADMSDPALGCSCSSWL